MNAPEILVTGGRGTLGRRVVDRLQATGREVLTSTELARAYLEASGRNKGLVGVPLPGKAPRTVREGAQLCPDKRYGTVRWEEFLREEIRHQRISGPAGEGI